MADRSFHELLIERGKRMRMLNIGMLIFSLMVIVWVCCFGLSAEAAPVYFVNHAKVDVDVEVAATRAAFDNLIAQLNATLPPGQQIDPVSVHAAARLARARVRESIRKQIEQVPENQRGRGR